MGKFSSSVGRFLCSGVDVGVIDRRVVNTGVKFPSLWVMTSHYGLSILTPLTMLSVWFQPAEVTEVITLERLFMLHELHAQGASISTIAQQTGLDRKTVRRHLAAGIQPPTYGPRAPRGSLIDAYHRAPAGAYCAVSGVVCPAAAAGDTGRRAMAGGYTILTGYLRAIRPCQQAQVDFAHFKVRFRCDPQVVRVVWLFFPGAGSFPLPVRALCLAPDPGRGGGSSCSDLCRVGRGPGTTAV